MSHAALAARIDSAFQQDAQAADPAEIEMAFFDLREALACGTVRAAEPDASQPNGWRVNAWVKRGILLGFRIGQLD